MPAGTDAARRLRDRLHENATGGIRAILAAHLAPGDVAPSLSLLTGAVLVRATYEGKQVAPAFLDDIIQRVLARPLAASPAETPTRHT